MVRGKGISRKRRELLHGMVDVSKKPVTLRVALAEGRVVLGKETFHALKNKKSPKGDVLETAKIAAVMAVKETPGIIPYCHTISIESIRVEFKLDEKRHSIRVQVTVKASSKTGVEMEALTGVSAACLSIYDMLKFKGQDMIISDIRLLKKSGGKSGTYVRQYK